VIGGGPAGAVAALVLARAGVEVTVYDARPGPSAKIGETLPPTLKPLLDKLGLTAICDAVPHLTSHGNLAYWGSDRPSENHFLFGPQGSGWHLDRQCFEAQLSEHAARAGAHFFWDHHAVEACEQGESWRLEVESSVKLLRVEAELVVDATGRHARFIRGLGVRRKQHDRLSAIACSLPEAPKCAAKSEAYALVEATSQGWWYTAPLSKGRRVVLFAGDGDLLSIRSVRSSEGLACDAGRSDSRRALCWALVGQYGRHRGAAAVASGQRVLVGVFR
jgi:flavin-dependent dehydrogenase